MAIRNNLNDIVNVDIAISTPGSSDEVSAMYYLLLKDLLLERNQLTILEQKSLVFRRLENLRTMAFQQNHRHTLWRM